jgi:serine/threonine protein kinase
MANKELPVGYKINGYTISKKISYGGFSIVYLAFDNKDCPYAIKEFFPNNLHLRSSGTVISYINETERTRFESGLKAFKTEAEIVMNIKHDNIIDIINFFETNGTAYLVMPYEYGMTLNRYIALNSKMNENILISVAVDIFSAIKKFHDNKIVHLDLKPGNIWIRPNGEALILDFGAARDLDDLEKNKKLPLHTPGYAAPEQHKEYFRPSRIGPWSDYYGLGATLFALIEKRPPALSVDYLKQNNRVSIVKDRMAQYDLNLLNLITYLMQPEWGKRKMINFSNVISMLSEFKDLKEIGNICDLITIEHKSISIIKD